MIEQIVPDENEKVLTTPISKHRVKPGKQIYVAIEANKENPSVWTMQASTARSRYWWVEITSFIGRPKPLPLSETATFCTITDALKSKMYPDYLVFAVNDLSDLGELLTNVTKYNTTRRLDGLSRGN